MVDYMDQGRDLLYAGRFREAIDCFDNVPSDYTGYFLALEMKGIALRFMGRFPESIAAFDECLKIYPDWGNKDTVFTNKGDTLSMMNKFQEANDCYKQALEINPESEDALRGLGIANVILKNYNEAIGYLDNLLKISPANAAAFSWKGEALMGLGKYEEALNQYDMSLCCDPRDEDVIELRKQALISLNRNPQETSDEWVERGSTAMIFSTTENVLYCFDKAIQLDQRNETAWIYKGNILLGVTNPDGSPNFKNIGDALNCYNIALNINPDNDEVYYYSANAMESLGQLEEASKFCLTGLERCMNSDKLWAKQGVIFFKLGRLDEATECFRTALSINPDNFEAKKYTGQI